MLGIMEVFLGNHIVSFHSKVLQTLSVCNGSLVLEQQIQESVRVKNNFTQIWYYTYNGHVLFFLWRMSRCIVLRYYWTSTEVVDNLHFWIWSLRRLHNRVTLFCTSLNSWKILSDTFLSQSILSISWSFRLSNTFNTSIKLMKTGLHIQLSFG